MSGEFYEVGLETHVVTGDDSENSHTKVHNVVRDSAPSPRTSPFQLPRFTSATKNDLLRDDQVNYVVPMLTEDPHASEIGSNGVTFRSFRHTFICRPIPSGVNPKVAQARARHSTITLTMDRYAHVVTGDVSVALEALPELPGLEPQVVVALGEAFIHAADG